LQFEKQLDMPQRRYIVTQHLRGCGVLEESRGMKKWLQTAEDDVLTDIKAERSHLWHIAGWYDRKIICLICILR